MSTVKRLASKTKFSKKQMTIGIAAIVLIVLGVALGLSRGWARATGVLSLSRSLYQSSVTETYDANFLPFQKKLDNLGFKLIDKTTIPYNERDGLNTYEPLQDCYVLGYQGISESVQCQKANEFKPESPEAFKQLWVQKSPEIVSFLESNGWRKEYADQTSFTQLIDALNTGHWLRYVKDKGSIRCELTIAYNPPPDYVNPDDQIWVNQFCFRDIKFFGGY